MQELCKVQRLCHNFVRLKTRAIWSLHCASVLSLFANILGAKHFLPNTIYALETRRGKAGKRALQKLVHHGSVGPVPGQDVFPSFHAECLMSTPVHLWQVMEKCQKQKEKRLMLLSSVEAQCLERLPLRSFRCSTSPNALGCCPGSSASLVAWRRTLGSKATKERVNAI